MRRFHEVMGPVEFDNFKSNLIAWGYPRMPELAEFARSWIYNYGPDSAFWIERVPGEHAAGILHLAVDPKTQKQHGIAPRRLFYAIDFAADLMGLDRLIANDCTETGEVTDYLRRLGWKPCTMKTIGGEWYERSFVDGEAQEESHEPALEPEHLSPRAGGGPGSEEGGDGERTEESRSATRTGRECLRTP